MTNGLQGEQGDKGETGEQGDTGAREPVTRVFVIILIASIVVIGIGVQAYFGHQDQEERDLADRQHDRMTEVCFKEWSDDFRDTVNLARGYTKELEAALKQRNETLDQVVLDFVAGQNLPEGEPPPPEVVDDFYADLAAFTAAREHLVAVQAQVDENRAENTYPTLQMTCEAGRKAAEDVE
jgi:hypothetical protein